MINKFKVGDLVKQTNSQWVQLAFDQIRTSISIECNLGDRKVGVIIKCTYNKIITVLCDDKSIEEESEFCEVIWNDGSKTKEDENCLEFLEQK